MAFIGDTNNMANSLIVGGLKVGMDVSIASPASYKLHPEIEKFVKAYSGFVRTENPMEAARGADVVVTDVWASMGDEEEAEQRKKDFAGYQVNNEIMASAARDAVILHCLPAHRGEEITAEVFESHADEIFDEAENRLHAQKAVMVKLMQKV